MIKPFIIVAHTADGFIAPGSQSGQSVPSTTWTSGADKKIFVELTKKAGVMIMGLKTYETIGKPLKDRVNIVYAPEGTPAIAGIELTSKPPLELLADLERRGFSEVAICGGSTIYTMFLKSGAVDTIYITIEPKLFGKGMTIFNEEVNIDLNLISVKNLSDNVLMLEYKIKK